MRVEEVPLPGIGVRHDLVTEAGRRVSLVSHRSGRRELLVQDEQDPDVARELLVLTTEEAEAIAAVLGATRITRELTGLAEQVAGLVVEWIEVPATSRYVGSVLGDTKARTRTGASVVAIVRGGRIDPSPGPEHDLHGRDTLVVVGTPTGVRDLGALLDG